MTLALWRCEPILPSLSLLQLPASEFFQGGPLSLAASSRIWSTAGPYSVCLIRNSLFTPPLPHALILVSRMSQTFHFWEWETTQESVCHYDAMHADEVPCVARDGLLLQNVHHTVAKPGDTEVRFSHIALPFARHWCLNALIGSPSLSSSTVFRLLVWLPQLHSALLKLPVSPPPHSHTHAHLKYFLFFLPPYSGKCMVYI